VLFIIDHGPYKALLVISLLHLLLIVLEQHDLVLLLCGKVNEIGKPAISQDQAKYYESSHPVIETTAEFCSLQVKNKGARSLVRCSLNSFSNGDERRRTRGFIRANKLSRQVHGHGIRQLMEYAALFVPNELNISLLRYSGKGRHPYSVTEEAPTMSSTGIVT
jgi:hypothetical protein